MKKGDIALIIVAVIILAIWLIPSQNGDTVSIYIDGEIYKTLPLDKDAQVMVESDFGRNNVIVKNKQVYITDADCPDKLCEKSAIAKSGRSIVCLPNRLSVIIEDGKSDEKIDVIV